MSTRRTRLGVTDLPYGARAPSVDFEARDLQDGSDYVDESTVLRDYVAKGRRTLPAVYAAYVSIDDVPNPQLAEDVGYREEVAACRGRQRKLGWPDEDDPDYENCDAIEPLEYDWGELRRGGTTPPAKLLVTRTGKIAILDGNHRIEFWSNHTRPTYTHIPAWVIDERFPQRPRRRS